MKRVIVMILVFLLGLQYALAQIPAINSYVTDNAGILSPTAKSQLENDLRNFKKLPKKLFPKL